MDAVAEIKSRIAIEDLVAQYVPLKKVGRNFRGLCPFHSERSPSFYVSPERALAYCFGCHKGGDHFSFIQEIEGLDFRGALQLLADKAGVTLPQLTNATPRMPKSARDRLTEMHEKATAFFEQQLWESSEGDKTRTYMKKRGVSEELMKIAHLGYAPDTKDALYSHLLKAGFDRSEILSAGLVLARDTHEHECIDRFRARLMIPIKSLAGTVCAFGGRALREGDEPKYLNSPETPIYHKSSILYGLSDAKPSIRTSSCAVIVEGYMDCLSAHAAGFTNTVACSGTALTEDQLALLKRFTRQLVLALDADSAGQAATERALLLALSQDFTVHVAVWNSTTKDPDECIRKDPEAFQEAIRNPQSALTFLLNLYGKRFDLTTIEGKKNIAETLMPFLGIMQSPLERDEWVKSAATRLGVKAQVLYDELKRFQGKQKKTYKPEPESLKSEVKITPQQYVLGLVLGYPETVSLAREYLKPEHFSEIKLQNIYRYALTQYNPSLDGLTAEEKHHAQELILLIESRLKDGDLTNIPQEFAQATEGILKEQYTQQKRALVEKLKTAPLSDKPGLIDLYQDMSARHTRTLQEISLLWQKK